MRTPVALTALLVTALAGCEQQPALEPPGATPSSAVSAPAPGPSPAAPVDLPAGALLPLVPQPGEVATGLVPLLQASGPRDAAAVAAFSSDPAAARAALTERGFADAYVVQYASPSDPRALTAVVVRFATAGGAEADYGSDVAAGGGTPVDAAAVGEASDVRRVDLPDEPAAELVTVRVRREATTWLLAWKAPRPADASIPLELARRLVERA